MVQTAKVTRIIDGGRAEVAVKRQSACGHDCASCGGGCSEMMVSPTVAVVAENLVHAMPGDTVKVESATKKILGAAALVYLVPLALFFLGYFLCRAVRLPDSVSTIAGLAGLVLGVALAVLTDRRIRRRRSISFRITAIDSAG